MSQRFLPPLEADTNYRVADFEFFELGRAVLHASPVEGKGTLHLHLKNRTMLDLPVSDEQLQHLMRVLIHAFPQMAIDEIKSQPWGKAAFRSEAEKQ